MPPIVPVPNERPEGSEDELSGTNLDSEPQMDLFESDNSNADEDPTHEGYELLSQEAENYTNGAGDAAQAEDSDVDSDEDVSVVEHEPSSNHFMASQVIDEFSHGSKSNEAKLSVEKEIQMAQDHIDKIKDVMKGIVLPVSSLPHWASVVPEEEWKAQLISSLNSEINNKTADCADDKDTAFLPSTSKEAEKNSGEYNENKQPVSIHVIRNSTMTLKKKDA